MTDSHSVSAKLASGEYLLTVMRGDKFLPMLLGFHLAIEQLLVEWLEMALPNPNALFSKYRPSFRQIVALCAAQGLIADDFAIVLYKFNELRNKYAHHLAFQLDQAAANELFDAMLKVKEPLILSAPDIAVDEEVAAVFAWFLGDVRNRVRD